MTETRDQAFERLLKEGYERQQALEWERDLLLKNLDESRAKAEALQERLKRAEDAITLWQALAATIRSHTKESG